MGCPGTHQPVHRSLRAAAAGTLVGAAGAGGGVALDELICGHLGFMPIYLTDVLYRRTPGYFPFVPWMAYALGETVLEEAYLRAGKGGRLSRFSVIVAALVAGLLVVGALARPWAVRRILGQEKKMQALTSEPEIVQGERPEGAFQRAIVAETRALLNRVASGYVLLEVLGLDIAIFNQDSSRQRGRFLELKAFVGGWPGAVGFGNQQGEGLQVDLLL